MKKKKKIIKKKKNSTKNKKNIIKKSKKKISKKSNTTKISKKAISLIFIYSNFVTNKTKQLIVEPTKRKNMKKTKILMPETNIKANQTIDIKRVCPISG